MSYILLKLRFIWLFSTAELPKTSFKCLF